MPCSPRFLNMCKIRSNDFSKKSQTKYSDRSGINKFCHILLAMQEIAYRIAVVTEIDFDSNSLCFFSELVYLLYFLKRN